MSKFYTWFISFYLWFNVALITVMWVASLFVDYIKLNDLVVPLVILLAVIINDGLLGIREELRYARTYWEQLFRGDSDDKD